MSAVKVSEQVAMLEVRLKLAERERDDAVAQLRANPPFTNEEADHLCRDLWDVFTGRRALPRGVREYALAVRDRSTISHESALPYSTGPMFRTVRVSW